VKIYMNRTIRQYFEIEQAGGEGRRRAHLRERRRPPVASCGAGWKIRTVDSLLETEARVV
jgi:hypothetical protein